MGEERDQTRTVMVRRGDSSMPYSKGLMANTIMASGLNPARAYQVAHVIEDRLHERGTLEVNAEQLTAVAVETIRAEGGTRYAAAYERWVVASSVDLPLIILVGGGTGVGKSTISTQLAARLGIVRVISTDAIREVMKAVFSREFLPTLYQSSFDAAEVVKAKSGRAEDAVLVGFRDQVAAVSVGVSALIRRAIDEGTDIIIEGAHIAPGFLNFSPFHEGAVVVPLVIQVEDEALHRSHLEMRGLQVRARPVERYLAHFANIRKIQKYIKSQALQHGVPIISNYNLDACLASVIDHVVQRAYEAAKGRPQRQPRPVHAIRGGSP